MHVWHCASTSNREIRRTRLDLLVNWLASVDMAPDITKAIFFGIQTPVQLRLRN
jgi:hypothetical protein